MSVQSVVFAALGPLVSGRCFPNNFEQASGALPAWPAIRYAVRSEENAADQCGTDETSGTDDTGLQLDIVAPSYSALVALKSAVILAMAAITSPPCTRDGSAGDLYDAETKTHRSILFFTFYSSST